MKRILGYFVRDKVDLIWMIITIILMFTIASDPLLAYGLIAWMFFWIIGAVIRMGTFIDIIKDKDDQIKGLL